MSNQKFSDHQKPVAHRWSLAAWLRKFYCAFRGIYLGSRNETSFVIHYGAAVIVAVSALLLGCTLIECSVLAICITLVWMAELFNSAIESLTRSLSTEYDPTIGQTLDIASGAVLIAALGSTIVGCLILVPKLVAWIQ
jgi:diacylglycerol kinase